MNNQLFVPALALFLHPEHYFSYRPTREMDVFRAASMRDWYGCDDSFLLYSPEMSHQRIMDRMLFSRGVSIPVEQPVRRLPVSLVEAITFSPWWPKPLKNLQLGLPEQWEKETSKGSATAQFATTKGQAGIIVVPTATIAGPAPTCYFEKMDCESQMTIAYYSRSEKKAIKTYHHYRNPYAKRGKG